MITKIEFEQLEKTAKTIEEERQKELIILKKEMKFIKRKLIKDEYKRI